MRKITIATAVLMLAGLAGAAYAQTKEDYDIKHQIKAREAAELDKQYRTILQLTDKPTDVKVDPWRNMRGTDASKTNN